ncbi:cation transporter [Candidatus Micrarchaeota archaeon]|nr:cation transporter [Candidatus Micrarchaeota archaeon]
MKKKKTMQSHKGPLTESTEGSKKLHAASFSIGASLFLITIKLAATVVTGSLALLAELLHSVFDLLASILAYLGIRKAEQPADKTHLYGHEKFENLSSLAQTLLIVATSVLIIYEALNRINAPTKIEVPELGLFVMAVTLTIDYFVSRYLHSASSKYGSSALEADAYHFTTDLWGALAVIAGLAFVYLGYPVFDSLAAIAVALLMLWISYALGKKAFHVLMDWSPADSTVEQIERIVSSTPGVKHFHKLRARQAGNKLLVELHIKVSPRITLRKGHRIAHNVKKKLMRGMSNIKDVTIHVEPLVSTKKSEEGLLAK